MICSNDSSNSGAPTRLGLIRHARTLWNIEKRIQGQKDSALTDEGEHSAGQWGKILAGFGWHRILASDTGRAFKTAQQVNATLKVPITTDARLREQEWGDWTGMTIPAVTSLFSQMPPEQTGVGWEFRPPGGESRNEMWDRGERVLIDAAERWPGALILVVTHSGMIRCLINRLLGLQFLATEPRVLRPAHLHLLTCENGSLNIDSINALDLTVRAE